MKYDLTALADAGIQIGARPKSWMEGEAKDITLCITEDCNLSCRYCYMTNKNTKNKMSLDMAKKSVDFFLLNRDDFPEKAAVWNFIGGEPLLEMELIDQITDYIKVQSYKLNHPWFENYMLNFSTNGTFYHKPDFQQYIQKNRRHVSVGISIDGNKIKHDLQRVKPDGSGSYDEVVKNVPLWLKQFPGSLTKATFSHDDLPFLKDSIISLWDLGIKAVAANLIFEDVWQEGDEIIYETQLKELADYVIKHELWKDCSVTMFSPYIGHPLTETEKKQNYCGAGKMIAVNYQGNLYPCIRFYDISLQDKKGLIIGNIFEGINYDLLRPFEALDLVSQSKEECVQCEIASGCSWCTGANYDFAKAPTIFKRGINLCKMHRANVNAKNYLFDQLFIKNPELLKKVNSAQNDRIEFTGDLSRMHLLIMTSDTITPHCLYRNWHNTDLKISQAIFNKALKFAQENNFSPVLLTTDTDLDMTGIDFFCVMRGYLVDKTDVIRANTILNYDNNSSNSLSDCGICNLLINSHNINKITDFIKDLYKAGNYRVNIVLEEIDQWKNNELNLYNQELDRLNEFIIKTYEDKKDIEINILTDLLYIDSMVNCEAGERIFTVAPNGKIYICPAFYFNDPNDCIGTIDDGIQFDFDELLKLDKAPICKTCDVYHCKRCKFLNKKLTLEYNIPSRIQCLVSHTERNKTIELQNVLQKKGLEQFPRKIIQIDYLDPLDKMKLDKKGYIKGNID